MINRHVKVRRLPGWKGREIAISDIHGDLKTYEKLLDQVNYRPGEDRLILLGDLVEKGTENLPLLRKVMKQTEEEIVFCIKGNCDFTATNFLLSYRLGYIHKILLDRQKSLIHEMIREAGLPEMDENTDMDQLAEELRKRYLPELTFLHSLPHMLITPERIYVHAGLQNEKTGAEDFRDVMTCPLFDQTAPAFRKTVVVGHMPVTEYCVRKADFSCRFNGVKNLWSIDGGNVVKRAGQLNALIFEGSVIRTEYADRLPEVRVLHTVQAENRSPFFVPWNHGEVQIIEKGPLQSSVHSDYLNRSFWIDNEFLRDNRGSDFTNFQMPVVAGETVSLVCLYGKKAQIKKHGVLGWTDALNLDLDALDMETLMNAANPARF